MLTTQCVDDGGDEDDTAAHNLDRRPLQRVVRDERQRYSPPAVVGEAAGGYIRESYTPWDALLEEVEVVAEVHTPTHRRYNTVLLATAAAGRAGIGMGRPLGCTPRIEALRRLAGSLPEEQRPLLPGGRSSRMIVREACTVLRMWRGNAAWWVQEPRRRRWLLSRW